MQAHTFGKDPLGPIQAECEGMNGYFAACAAKKNLLAVHVVFEAGGE